MVSTMAWNVRDVDLIPALDAIFPIFITTDPMRLVAMTMILYKLYGVLLCVAVTISPLLLTIIYTQWPVCRYL